MGKVLETLQISYVFTLRPVMKSLNKVAAW